MKASELRIGNWLKLPSGVDFQVDSDDISLISKWTKNAPMPKPIPLTEEWLLKFGFDITGLNVMAAVIGDNPVTRDYILVLNKTDEYWFYKNAYHKVEYVHQLQNLYHALTGEELTVKEATSV